MSDPRDSGEHANPGPPKGRVLETLSPNAPLTKPERDLLDVLGSQGFDLSGLKLARRTHGDELFVQHVEHEKSADASRQTAPPGFDVSALSAEGTTAREKGRYDIAIPCFLLALRLRLHLHGLDDPATVEALNDLGETLHEHGELVDSCVLFETMRQVCMRQVGPAHPYTVCASNNLAAVLFDLGQVQRACEMQRDVYETLQREAGPDHAETQGAANNLANMLVAQGDVGADRKLSHF